MRAVEVEGAGPHPSEAGLRVVVSKAIAVWVRLEVMVEIMVGACRGSRGVVVEGW